MSTDQTPALARATEAVSAPIPNINRLSHAEIRQWLARAAVSAALHDPDDDVIARTLREHRVGRATGGTSMGASCSCSCGRARREARRAAPGRCRAGRDPRSRLMTARDYLAAVQQRADSATEGPWDGEEFSNAIVAPAIGLSDDGVRYAAVAEDVYTMEDCEFITASRTDVPRLVAALTAALDGQPEFIPTPPGPQRAVRDTDLRNAGIAEGWRQARAAIADALTPKENDS
jgi:hypothetical protein